MPNLSPLGQAALEYARLGYLVLPLCWPDANGACACGGRSHGSKNVGKAPITAHAHKDATTNEGTITEWWTRTPEANIGIALAESNLFVIGPDSEHWHEAFRQRGLPPTSFAQTGGGDGHFHYYYRLPERCPRHRVCNSGQYDALSEGYVVAPPSLHRCGKHYSWLDPLRNVTALPEAPEWAVEMLRQAVEHAPASPSVQHGINAPPVRLVGQALTHWNGERVKRTPDGRIDRSATLFAIGLWLARTGASVSTITSALAERDVTLGFEKYNQRRDDREYLRVAEKAVATAERQARGRTSVSGDGSGDALEAPGFKLTSLGTLLAEPETKMEWVWDNVLSVGGISIIAAKPKVGKSTLAHNLALAVARGVEFLGRTTRPGPVVYLALEDKREGVREHFEKLGAKDEPIYIHADRAPNAPLVEMIEALREAIQTRGAVLAVVDPLFRMIRVKEVNEYGVVNAALEPLVALARETGCHILLIHHAGKGERVGGDAILGSTAIYAAVDTAMIMVKREGYRIIESQQRYGKDLPKTALAFDEASGSLTVLGSVESLDIAKAEKDVLEALGHERMTEQEIKGAAGGNTGLIGKALRRLVERGDVGREGEGKKGSPFVYFLMLVSRFSDKQEASKRENENPAEVAVIAGPATPQRPFPDMRVEEIK